MKRHLIRQEDVDRFVRHLHREERAAGTIGKYERSVRAFAAWLAGGEASKERVSEWKKELLARGKSPGTINGALAALHGFFAYMGWDGMRVKFLKVQRRMFCDAAREMSREEYLRLVSAANRGGNARLALILQTICSTGIRVSELRYITAEAARAGRADIALKGKIRTILIPHRLARKLLKYAQNEKIASGEIFITKGGRGVSRRQIWGEMKRLCRAAGVDTRKVFPHNLRHLFARSYYKQTRDIVKLADVLGHSSIDTTRIYLISTGAEHQSDLDRLGLVS